jgi:hypothetical protein
MGKYPDVDVPHRWVRDFWHRELLGTCKAWLIARGYGGTENFVVCRGCRARDAGALCGRSTSLHQPMRRKRGKPSNLVPFVLPMGSVHRWRDEEGVMRKPITRLRDAAPHYLDPEQAALKRLCRIRWHRDRGLPLVGRAWTFDGVETAW